MATRALETITDEMLAPMKYWQCLGCLALLALGSLISFPIVLGVSEMRGQTCLLEQLLEGSIRWTALLPYLPVVIVSFALAAILLGATLRRLPWLDARRLGARSYALHPLWLAAALIVALPFAYGAGDIGASCPAGERALLAPSPVAG